MNQKITDIDLNEFDLDDFGFSFIDEEIEETKETKERLEKENMTSQEQIIDLEKRLGNLYNAIIPFLDNLCKSPEKSTIHWPNRVEKIQQYKSKLKRIVEGTK